MAGAAVGGVIGGRTEWVLFAFAGFLAVLIIAAAVAYLLYLARYKPYMLKKRQCKHFMPYGLVIWSRELIKGR